MAVASAILILFGVIVLLCKTLIWLRQFGLDIIPPRSDSFWMLIHSRIF